MPPKKRTHSQNVSETDEHAVVKNRRSARDAKKTDIADKKTTDLESANNLSESGCKSSTSSNGPSEDKLLISTKQTPKTTHKSTPATSTSTSSSAEARLPRSFFEQDCSQLAVALLGKKLVRLEETSGERVEAYIVETEAYLGEPDKAAHSYQLKRTAKNEAMFLEPGTIYVYHIYGMYTCINISSKVEGCAVLVRAVDPCNEAAIAAMSRLRTSGRKSKMAADSSKSPTNKTKTLKITDLGSGPAKLTQALAIDKAGFDQSHMSDNKGLWLEEGFSVTGNEVVRCPRIGINYAGDWVDKPLRFYVLDNRSVSVRHKDAEQEVRKKMAT